MTVGQQHWQGRVAPSATITVNLSPLWTDKLAFLATLGSIKLWVLPVSIKTTTTT